MSRRITRSYTQHPQQPGSSVASLSEVDLRRLRDEFTAKQIYLENELRKVEPLQYYRDMFPEDSFEEVNGISRKPNGILSVLNDKEFRGRSYNRLIFDDLSEITAYLDKETVLISPIGFSGRRRLSKYAYQIFGFVFDLDNVGLDEIADLLHEMDQDILPQATYIVNSGTGLHVVYLFETPIPALPQYYESLNRLKQDLAGMIWNQYTSRDEKKQHQGIFQAYRAVGSPTKLGKEYRATAYQVGKKTSIKTLNRYADKENRCLYDDWEHVTLSEAEEIWSRWYKRRIVDGNPVGAYSFTNRISELKEELKDFKGDKKEYKEKISELDKCEKQLVRRRAWYDSWIEKMKKGAFDGNRYYCIGILFNYAMKAEIPLEEAYGDAVDLIPYLNGLTRKQTNQFTENDVISATKYYDRKYIKMGREGILRNTKIDIGVTKRKPDDVKAERIPGEKQAEHLEEARSIRDVRMKRKNRDWRDGNGRPSKQAIVETWQAEHPGATKYQCNKETGIDPKTIRKWWKG